MDIERASIADIDVLTELRLAYLREDFGALDPQVESTIVQALPVYFREHMNRDLFCFVAREGRTVAAVAMLLVIEKPPSPAFINGRTGTVLNVYTRPEYRRKGLGRRVMERLREYARAADLSVVNLKATDAGHPLYLSVGFKDEASKYRPMQWNR